MADIGQTRLANSPSTIGRLPIVGATTIRTAIRPVLDTPRWPTQTISQRSSAPSVSAKVVVIGHSYGALTALFLAVNHKELVRALVLAEPPAICLLEHLPGDRAQTGEAMFQDIQRRMVAPMQQAFRRGDRDAGVGVFMAYVFNDPHAWDQMAKLARDETLRDAHEWDVMMTTGTLFPNIEPRAIQKITAPVLLLSGAKSDPFLAPISEELARLLPNGEEIILPDAGHQMWYQAPDVCRKDVETFLGRIGIQPSTGSGL